MASDKENQSSQRERTDLRGRSVENNILLTIPDHRTSVTVAAGALQKAGVIEYTRGVMTILNRRGLERAACECHRAIRRITAYNGMK